MRRMRRRIEGRAEERLVGACLARLAEERPSHRLPPASMILARALGRPRRKLASRALMPIAIIEAVTIVLLLTVCGGLLVLWGGDILSSCTNTIKDIVSEQTGGSGSLLALATFAALLVATLSGLVAE